jgi:hypothetical protein
MGTSPPAIISFAGPPSSVTVTMASFDHGGPVESAVRDDRAGIVVAGGFDDAAARSGGQIDFVNFQPAVSVGLVSSLVIRGVVACERDVRAFAIGGNRDRFVDLARVEMAGDHSRVGRANLDRGKGRFSVRLKRQVVERVGARRKRHRRDGAASRVAARIVACSHHQSTVGCV